MKMEPSDASPGDDGVAVKKERDLTTPQRTTGAEDMSTEHAIEAKSHLPSSAEFTNPSQLGSVLFGGS